MALTWQGARDKVRGDLWRNGTTGVPDEVCDRALHTSLLELEQARRWLWLENIRRTVALPIDAATFAAPADFRSIVSIAQVRADGKMLDAMTPLPIARVRILASMDPSTAWPTNYAFDGGAIFLSGTVPAGTQFEIIGIVSTPEDQDAAVETGLQDGNLTLGLHQAAVIAAAAAHVAGTFLKNEAEEMRQRRAYERILERLNDREDEARADNYGPGIIPDTYYRDISGC